MDERELVEIEQRARRLPRQQREDFFKLILEIRTLKAKNELIRLSPDELAFIIQGYEQNRLDLRRSLKRLVDNLDKPQIKF